MTFNGYSYFISILTPDVSVNLQHDHQVLKYSIQTSFVGGITESWSILD
jgi:hypothetical protein